MGRRRRLELAHERGGDLSCGEAEQHGGPLCLVAKVPPVRSKLLFIEHLPALGLDHDIRVREVQRGVRAALRE